MHTIIFLYIHLRVNIIRKFQHFRKWITDLWHLESSSSVANRAGIRWQRSTSPNCWCLEKILKILWGCSGWCLQGHNSTYQITTFLHHRDSFSHLQVTHLSHMFRWSIIRSSYTRPVVVEIEGVGLLCLLICLLVVVLIILPWDHGPPSVGNRQIRK